MRVAGLALRQQFRALEYAAFGIRQPAMDYDKDFDPLKVAESLCRLHGLLSTRKSAARPAAALPERLVRRAVVIDRELSGQHARRMTGMMMKFQRGGAERQSVALLDHHVPLWHPRRRPAAAAGRTA